MSDLEIKAVADERRLPLEQLNQRILDNNPFLFTLPLACAIAAPRGAGKSTLLHALVLRYVGLGIFKPEHIFIFSPSVKMDPALMNIPLPDSNKFDGFNHDKVNEIIVSQKRILENPNKKIGGRRRTPHILLIFDDCIMDKKAMARHGALAEIFIRGRHWNCHCIVTAQKWNMLATPIRANAAQVVIFKPFAFSELESFVESYITKKRRNDFIKWVKGVFEEQPHTFLAIDHNQRGKYHYSINFQAWVDSSAF
jgi:hypothetical protein